MPQRPPKPPCALILPLTWSSPCLRVSEAILILAASAVFGLLVPAACGCAEAVRELIFQAHQADVPLFLVHASGRLPAAVEQVASRSGWSSLRVADDVRDVLGKTYNQTGLTAILVDSRGMVSLAHQLRPGLQLASKFEMLRAGTPAPSPPQ